MAACNRRALARVAKLADLIHVNWRPLPPLDYALGVVAGLALGAAVAGVAIWAAILTA